MTDKPKRPVLPKLPKRVKKEPVENKPLKEIGEVARVGKVLSEYLRGISTERTELTLNPTTGKTEIVSKAEALARTIWNKALGVEYDEGTHQYVQTGNVSIAWIKFLVDRIEGKTGVTSDDPASLKPDIAERISDVNRDRLNALVMENETLDD